MGCRRGFKRQPENSKRAHFRAPALQKHQNSTKGPTREREKRSKIVASGLPTGDPPECPPGKKPGWGGLSEAPFRSIPLEVPPSRNLRAHLEHHTGGSAGTQIAPFGGRVVVLRHSNTVPNKMSPNSVENEANMNCEFHLSFIVQWFFFQTFFRILKFRPLWRGRGPRLHWGHPSPFFVSVVVVVLIDSFLNWFLDCCCVGWMC